MKRINHRKYSDCCGVKIYNNGLCSACKEHCGTEETQEISLMVLTTNGEAHHHILIYNKQEDKGNDMDERVQHMVDELYNTNECWYLYSLDKILSFTDHSDEKNL